MVPDGENRKPKGSGARNRSALIVPLKAGNRDHRDPLEGKRVTCAVDCGVAVNPVSSGRRWKPGSRPQIG